MVQPDPEVISVRTAILLFFVISTSAAGAMLLVSLGVGDDDAVELTGDYTAPIIVKNPPRPNDLASALRRQGLYVGQRFPDIPLIDTKRRRVKLTGRKRYTVIVFGCLT